MMTFQATVLYIEDDEASRVLVERVLTYAGYRVLIASRALDGIDLARKHHPDLILTDINLPDLSGREIAVRLRSDSQLKTVPIVALIPQRQLAEQDRSFVAGISGAIAKPIDVNTFIHQIEHFLQGGGDAIDPAAFEPASPAYRPERVEQLETSVRQLETNYRDLRRADQIKNDFIQLTAHELRTPLTNIKSYAETLAQEDGLPLQTAKDFLGVILNEVDRMTRIVRDLLTLSRLDYGKMDWHLSYFSPGRSLRAVFTAMSLEAKNREQTFSLDGEDALPQMLGDGERIEQVFMNIISNAIKYTPKGGRIDVAARAADDWIEVTVKDNGIGIPAENIPRLFERFYRVDKARSRESGGTGLGLAIAKEIVDYHGGSISVESKVGKGTEMSVRLPLEPRGKR